jgi:hypothetical protein
LIDLVNDECLEELLYIHDRKLETLMVFMDEVQNGDILASEHTPRGKGYLTVDRTRSTDGMTYLLGDFKDGKGSYGTGSIRPVLIYRPITGSTGS